MIGLKGIAGAGLIAASMLVGGAVWLPADSQTSHAARVTTDTPEFCAHLVQMMRETIGLSPPPREVAALSSEGQRECDSGDVRRGVLRLRQAMRLLLNGVDAPAQ